MAGKTKNFEHATILLPAMNETYSLRQTVEILLQTCRKQDLAEMIILLSEKSDPACIAVAEQLCRKYPKKVWIHMQKLPFVGGACREGFALAKGSHVVLMSSDLETDPYTVGRLIRMAKKHPACVVTASRWQKGCRFQGYQKIKLVCNFIFQKMLAVLYGTKLTDLTFAFRIFPTELVKGIRWEELKHPFFLETALKPLRLGVKFIEIPADWTARTEGISQNGFFANFKYIKTAVRIRFCKKSKLLKQDRKKGYGKDNR